jgi:GNAT superfamily N-acetyltransferase
MQSPAIIDQMKLSEKDEVLAFLRSAYAENPRQSDPWYWDWHFPESPYCDPDNLPVWLAKVDGQVAGQLAAVPVEFNVADEVVRAIWILDLIVDPRFRRRGIARKLALQSLDFCPFVLGINTSKQHSTELLAGLGWNIFAKIPRYQKILFPGNAVREVSRLGPLRSAANLAFKPFRRTGASGDVGPIEPIEEFDPRFDEFWDEVRRQWGCCVTRNSKMLDWQFCRQPGKRYEILAHVRGGKVRGYVVMFFRNPNPNGVIEKAAISDICYASDGADETIDALLTAALKLGIDRRAGSVVTDVIDRRVERSLKRHGFWRVKSDMQLLANVPRHPAFVYDAANWYLTRGDSDTSIFEAANL